MRVNPQQKKNLLKITSGISQHGCLITFIRSLTCTVYNTFYIIQNNKIFSFSNIFLKLFRLSMCSICFITSLFLLFRDQQKKKLLRRKKNENQKRIFLHIHRFFFHHRTSLFRLFCTALVLFI